MTSGEKGTLGNSFEDGILSGGVIDEVFRFGSLLGMEK